MKAFLRELLKNNGTVSTMRVMALISLFAACGLAMYGIYTKVDLIGLTALCSAFLGAAFSGKAIQKSIESKKDIK